jgi:hypothetical protein
MLGDRVLAAVAAWRLADEQWRCVVIRSSVFLILMMFIVAPAPRASAGERGPVCRVPSVVDVMTREIRKRDYYARIEPRLIEEIPESARNTVWCGVTVWTLSYDARIGDGLPLGRCEQHAFRVQAVSNGFVVRYLR